MLIEDNTVGYRKIMAQFDENDLRTILSKYLVEKNKFPIDPRSTKIQLSFSRIDIDKAPGFEHMVELTLENELK